VSGDHFSQATIEDIAWDEAVLSSQFAAFGRALAGERVGLDALDVRLSPLQQILLANALSKGPPYPSRQGRGRTKPTERELNPILSTALARYRGEAQLPLPWIAGSTGQAWTFLTNLYLAQLTARFDDGISVMLRRANATGRLTGTQRQQLNGLLFQPLQNADQHGRNANPQRTFCGVAARVVDAPIPATPSLAEYLTALEETNAPAVRGPTQLLELIVHDNGPGIATHFYNAKRKEGEPDLHTLGVFHEWLFLNQAFERHQTSKPIGFRRATTNRLSIPGVGLAGMLSATKQLRAFLELRTGRLRAFQWYREGQVIADQNMLQPNGLPAAAATLPGTVLRFFVPLQAASETSGQGE
jgi:hypothetical protein